VSPGVVAEQSEPLREISCPCGRSDLQPTRLDEIRDAPPTDAQQMLGRQSETGEVRSRDRSPDLSGCRVVGRAGVEVLRI
jgi:hypothetical protein